MPTEASTYVHTDTPTLVVSDARGLVVRTVQFHRRETIDPLETRVMEQRFDAADRLVGRRDPYLFVLTQTEERVPENLNQSFSLSGVTVLTDSVDAGWRLALPGHAGHIVERWDGRGSHSLTEYDPLLRPVVVRESGRDVAGHTLECFTYAGTDAGAHNLCGQLIRHDDPAGTLRILDLGLSGALLKQARQFLRETNPPNWPNNDVERDNLLESVDGAITRNTYASTGEPLRQTDALGNIQAFAYTVDGQLKDTRLTLAGDGQLEQVLVSAIHYNATGQIESETAGNKVITRHHYDEANGRLTRLSAYKADGTPLQDLNYHYDAVGNVLSIEDAAQPIRYFNNQRIATTKIYRYDTLYQLIHATGCEAKNGRGGPTLPDLQPLPPDPNQIANYTQTYYYDAGGNLLDLVHVGAQAHGRTLTRARYSNRCLPERDNRPPTDDELANGFDANGNLRELQVGQSLGWDLRNQLREVRLVVREDEEDDCECYLYDGGGQRVRKVHSNQTNARTIIREVRYLPGLEIRSHSGTGETLHVIIASAGSNSVQVLHWAVRQPEDIPQDQVRYSLGDHLKSSTLELDQNADLISQEWYYPFGGTAWWAGRDATEAKYKTVRYSGKERDATGLYYYGLRYYAPWLQRWINPDPAGPIDGLNYYCMVSNNPITLLDVQGEKGEKYNDEDLKNFREELEKSTTITSAIKDSKEIQKILKKINKMKSVSKPEQYGKFATRILLLRAELKNEKEQLGTDIYRMADEFFQSALGFNSTTSGSYVPWKAPVFDLFKGTGRGAPHFSRSGRPSGSHRTQSRPQQFESNHQPGAFHSRGSQRPMESTLITPITLPSQTDEKIIEGYNKAVDIINNKSNISAIFPDEDEKSRSRRFKDLALLIHPDKLKLEKVPEVEKMAGEAFKIISNWRENGYPGATTLHR
ncbi:RHS repeat domain-containing protein [Pseudomonas sp. XS1P51]